MSSECDSPTVKLSLVKILWVHDDFDGPVNGLAEYKGEKVWFERIYLSSEEERTYNLKKVDSLYIEDILERNHAAYCEQTGAPLNHGDPLKMKRKIQMVNKVDLTKIIPKGEDSVEVTQRVLSNTKKFTHSYDPQNIPGEIFTTIKQGQFSNYLVPRRIEME
ncbi:Hypothetical protein HVR_LOCUS1095 [uncultured virus]|nr:Hypothetical protein HVR_LOCUS1095 [uncultured virus]